MEDNATPTAPVLGSFTLQAQLPQGKAFTISGYIHNSESVESLNERLDLLHNVIDRQRTRAEIPEIEVARDNLLERMKGNALHFAALLSRRDKGGRLTAQEKLQLDQMDVNNKAHEEKLAEANAKLAEMRALVGLKD